MGYQETMLKQIADAIRAKDGSTSLIRAVDFADRISAIEIKPDLPETAHTLTLTSDNVDRGTVSGGGIVTDGMTVTAVATPVPGSFLEGWKEYKTPHGEGVSVEPSYEYVSREANYRFKMDGDRGLIATFLAAYTVTILISLDGAGTPTGAGDYALGSAVVLTANVAQGYQFVGWENEAGEIVSVEEEYTFTITESVTYKAVYQEYVSRLPEGYTEIEYIEQPAVGAQYCYIKSPQNINSNMRIVIDIEPLSIGSNGYCYLYNATYARKSGTSYYYTYNALRISNSGIFYGRGANTTNTGNYSQIDSNGTLRRLYCDVNCAEGYCKINNGEEIPIATPTYSVSVYPNLTNASTIASAGRARIFSYQYYLSGELKVDMVPCIAPSGEVGMYDLIGDTFHTKEGSSVAFVAGPPV